MILYHNSYFACDSDALKIISRRDFARIISHNKTYDSISENIHVSLTEWVSAAN